MSAAGLVKSRNNETTPTPSRDISTWVVYDQTSLGSLMLSSGVAPLGHAGGDTLIVPGLLSADALAQLKFNLGQVWWPQPGSGSQERTIYVSESIENATSFEKIEASASTEANEEADRRIVEHFRVRLEREFWNGRDEVFEDGMESEFSRALVDTVERGGISAVEAIREIVAGGHANEEVVGEALRWIGFMDHPLTRTARRRALENALVSPSARVRDGASLGLAFMDDPAAIPSVKRAIEREESEGLRHDLEQVLAQLEDTLECRSC